MLAELHDVRGYDVPVIDRYHQFFNQALKGKDAFWYYDFKSFDPSVLPFLNTLNVRYLFSKKDLSSMMPAHIKLVYDDEIKIYQNDQAQGLAYWVPNGVWVDTAEQALTEVIENKSKLADTVFLEGELMKPSNHQSKGVSSAQKTTILYSRIKANEVQMDVLSEQLGWLVFSQNHYPGWQARINAIKTEIFAANFVLQAIRIPAGAHTVTFTYEPFSFTLGWLVSLSSLILALWIIRRKTR